MARYNTVAPVNTQTGTVTIGTPNEGLFTTLTGTPPYTVTLSSPAVANGIQHGFYNNTGGQVTLQSPSGNIKGPGSNVASTFIMENATVVFLTSDGTDFILTGQISGGFINVDLTSSYTASASQTLWCNTSGGAFNVTLPASPSKGDTIKFFDVGNTFDTQNLTVVRNGQNIMGAADNLTVNTEGAAFELVYYDSTYGWRLFSI